MIKVNLVPYATRLVTRMNIFLKINLSIYNWIVVIETLALYLPITPKRCIVDLALRAYCSHMGSMSTVDGLLL